MDATTLEANAAMRRIVRTGHGDNYQEFLTGLAKESGIETPTREQLAQLDRKRKKRMSNEEWEHPHDPDGRIARMKDGSTNLAHKAEHAVDLDTGAIVAVTLQGADEGASATVIETVAEAGEGIAQTVAADKGYHSNAVLRKLSESGVRRYIPEPDRGRRKWQGRPAKQKVVYGNRWRVRGAHGKRLMRRRGEYIERSFAHLYETGAMRRKHLRGQAPRFYALRAEGGRGSSWLRADAGLGTLPLAPDPEGRRQDAVHVGLARGEVAEPRRRLYLIV